MKLSLRDLAEVLLLRGLVFSHEAVRDWEAKLAQLLTGALRKRRKGKIGRNWYVDETYLKIAGQWQYLYRAIDTDGNLVDVYLSATREQAAAEAFFRSAVAFRRGRHRHHPGDHHHRQACRLPAGSGGGVRRRHRAPYFQVQE